MGTRGHVGPGLIIAAIQYHDFNYTLSHSAVLCTGFSPLATEFLTEQKINEIFFKKRKSKNKPKTKKQLTQDIQGTSPNPVT